MLLVFIGAGLGGVLRHGTNIAALRLGWTAFPVSTLAVNIVGSLLMGLVAGVLDAHAGASPAWRLFLATGMLGGFTTFSAFSLDAVALWQRDRLGLAALYAASSVVLSIGALMLGLVMARAAARG